MLVLVIEYVLIYFVGKAEYAPLLTEFGNGCKFFATKYFASWIMGCIDN